MSCNLCHLPQTSKALSARAIGGAGLLAITRQWWYMVERGIPRINVIMKETSKSPRPEGWFASLLYLPPRMADRHIYASRHAGKPRPGGLAAYVPSRRMLVTSALMVTDPILWVITSMTVVNVLALLIPAMGAKLLLIFHMFEVFNHSIVLQNVMRSVTYRSNTLLQTAGLAIVCIYFFGVVAFMLFPEIFQFAEADVMGGRKLDPNNNGARCTSIWKCTLVVLDMGLRKEDIGEAMDDIQWVSEGPESGRILYRMMYTLLFFIIVSTILMNIIFGVIIDTFAELRAMKDETDKDMSYRCFICGVDRFVFDQLGDSSSGFSDHVEHDHNMWKYLFFQVYLREKDFDQYSGGESYVFDRTLELVRHPLTHEVLRDVDTGLELKAAKPQVDLSWFPQRTAMVLKQQRRAPATCTLPPPLLAPIPSGAGKPFQGSCAQPCYSSSPDPFCPWPPGARLSSFYRRRPSVLSSERPPSLRGSPPTSTRYGAQHSREQPAAASGASSKRGPVDRTETYQCGGAGSGRGASATSHRTVPWSDPWASVA
jgi:hypothetical protein